MDRLRTMSGDALKVTGNATFTTERLVVQDNTNLWSNGIEYVDTAGSTVMFQVSGKATKRDRLYYAWLLVKTVIQDAIKR